jgi:hypothetical protein
VHGGAANARAGAGRRPPGPHPPGPTRPRPGRRTWCGAPPDRRPRPPPQRMPGSSEPMPAQIRDDRSGCRRSVSR